MPSINVRNNAGQTWNSLWKRTGGSIDIHILLPSTTPFPDAELLPFPGVTTPSCLPPTPLCIGFHGLTSRGHILPRLLCDVKPFQLVNFCHQLIHSSYTQQCSVSRAASCVPTFFLCSRSAAAAPLVLPRRRGCFCNLVCRCLLIVRHGATGLRTCLSYGTLKELSLQHFFIFLFRRKLCLKFCL